MIRSVKLSLLALIGAVAAGPALTPSAAQRQSHASNDRLEQNFLAEHEIGRHFQVSPADLPAAKTGPIVTNRPLTVPYSGQSPQVPPGFTATSFATGLVNPRRLLVLPNGDVLVAEQSGGLR
jgi:glucose/arabinose dehydrogenase